MPLPHAGLRFILLTCQRRAALVVTRERLEPNGPGGTCPPPPQPPLTAAICRLSVKDALFLGRRAGWLACGDVGARVTQGQRLPEAGRRRDDKDLPAAPCWVARRHTLLMQRRTLAALARR